MPERKSSKAFSEKEEKKEKGRESRHAGSEAGSHHSHRSSRSKRTERVEEKAIEEASVVEPAPRSKNVLKQLFKKMKDKDDNERRAVSVMV